MKLTQEEIADIQWEIESAREWEQWRKDNGIEIIMPPLPLLERLIVWFERWWHK